jgi:methionyl-tRNA formyltransferase
VRVVALAYHDVGHACLEALIEAGDDVVGVVTHRDDPNEQVWFRSVADLAESHRIPVFTPADVNGRGMVARLRALRPDVIFSFYYRKLVSREILDLPPLGALNMHGSLLPRYRGRCPVNWVLVHGETETGVSLHHMVEKADAGDVVAQRKVPIDPEDTAFTLHRKLAPAARALLAETLPAIREGRAPRVPQDPTAASHFGRRGPEDGRIDWARPAREVHNLVRAVTHPYPGAFTRLGNRRLFVWWALPEAGGWSGVPEVDRVARIHAAPVPGRVYVDGTVRVETGDGLLRLVSCQLEGEDELPAAVFAERHSLRSGTILGRGATAKPRRRARAARA